MSDFCLMPTGPVSGGGLIEHQTNAGSGREACYAAMGAFILAGNLTRLIEFPLRWRLGWLLPGCLFGIDAITPHA
jgi:hypothetical protein